MKTRDRILATSLALFNQEGESNVSTNHIADEMDISPGNLYYHFRNKEEIILELFSAFRRSMDELLAVPSDQPTDLEDLWLFYHLMFEAMSEFRFLYHNLVDLTRRIRGLRRHFQHLIREKKAAAARICTGLTGSGVMVASAREVDALSTNMALVATYWLNFQRVQRNSSGKGDNDLAPAVHQTLTLLAPYLREPERSHLSELADAYR